MGNAGNLLGDGVGMARRIIGKRRPIQRLSPNHARLIPARTAQARSDQFSQSASQIPQSRAVRAKTEALNAPLEGDPRLASSATFLMAEDVSSSRLGFGIKGCMQQPV